MITVNAVRGHSLTVQGHAGYDVPGQDIVCAAASVLAYTAANAATEMYKKGHLNAYPTVRLDNGNACVFIDPKRRYITEAQTVFDTVLGGYTALQKAYPGYMEVQYDR